MVIVFTGNKNLSHAPSSTACWLKWLLRFARFATINTKFRVIRKLKMHGDKLFFRKQRRPVRRRVFSHSIQLLILFLRDSYTPPRTPRGDALGAYETRYFWREFFSTVLLYCSARVIGNWSHRGCASVRNVVRSRAAPVEYKRTRMDATRPIRQTVCWSSSSMEKKCN